MQVSPDSKRLQRPSTETINPGIDIVLVGGSGASAGGCQVVQPGRAPSLRTAPVAVLRTVIGWCRYSKDCSATCLAGRIRVVRRVIGDCSDVQTLCNGSKRTTRVIENDGIRMRACRRSPRTIKVVTFKAVLADFPITIFFDPEEMDRPRFNHHIVITESLNPLPTAKLPVQLLNHPANSGIRPIQRHKTLQYHSLPMSEA